VNDRMIKESVLQAADNQACIVGVNCKNTIKQWHNGSLLTLERKDLVSVQTPQTFDASIIKKAHDLALAQSFVGTDDSSLVERMGVEVRLIEGDHSNIKVTTPEDLMIAEKILEEKS